MTGKWRKTGILFLLTAGILCAGFFLLNEILNWGIDAVPFSSSKRVKEEATDAGGSMSLAEEDTKKAGDGKGDTKKAEDGMEPVEESMKKSESRELPIIMYHSVVEDASKRGPYVIMVEELERDLKWIRDHGYETVLMEDLIAFVKGDGKLPEKPFLITFDDGNYNNLYYVLPLLEKYEMKAVISAVGIYADQAETAAVQSEENGNAQNPNYDYLTWKELQQLDQNPLVEIQNHTYDLHEFGKRRGSARMNGESAADYIMMLAEDLSKMQNALEENAEVQATTFTYPYGIISEESLDVVKALGFQASLSCYEKKNTIRKGDAECLYLLNRYNRPSGADTDSFMQTLTGE